jgi:hypothetical protein
LGWDLAEVIFGSIPACRLIVRVGEVFIGREKSRRIRRDVHARQTVAKRGVHYFDNAYLFTEGVEGYGRLLGMDIGRQGTVC